MPFYRVFLFRLKPSTIEAQKQALIKILRDAKETVTGIVSLEIDPVTNMARGKGFDFGIAVCFEKMELLEAFDRHATCEKLQHATDEICDNSLRLIFDLEGWTSASKGETDWVKQLPEEDRIRMICCVQ